jgi:hypothetical protein
MPVRGRAVALAVVLTLVTVHAASDERAAPHARIEGRIIDAMTGHPSGNVRVDLVNAPEEGGARLHSTVSSPDGSFAFAGIDPGSYRLIAAADAVHGAYGQLRPGASPQAFRVAEGDRLAGLALPVWPGSVIEGAVVDARGRPRANVTVHAVSRGDSEFRARTASDAHGRFRFGRLWPGDYLVAAVQESAPAPVMGNESGAAMPRPFPVTFAPSAATLERALVVRLPLGARRSGIVIRTADVPFGRLLVRIGAEPVVGTYFQVRLYRDRAFGHLQLVQSAFETDQTTLAIDRVPVGSYALEIERKALVTNGPFAPYWPVIQPVDVREQITSEVRLDLERDAPLAPTVEVTASRVRPSAIVRGRVSGVPVDTIAVVAFPVSPSLWVEAESVASRFERAPVDASRAFTLAGLPAGDYYIGAVAESRLALWPLPFVLRKLSEGAARIRLRAGVEQTVTLRSPAWH